MTPDAVKHKDYNHLLLSEQMPVSKNTINSSNRHAKDGNNQANLHNHNLMQLDHITETAHDKSVATSTIMMQRIRSGSNNCREESPSFRSLRSNLGEVGGVGGGGSSDQLAVSIMRSSTNANA